MARNDYVIAQEHARQERAREMQVTTYGPAVGELCGCGRGPADCLVSVGYMARQACCAACSEEAAEGLLGAESPREAS